VQRRKSWKMVSAAALAFHTNRAAKVR